MANTVATFEAQVKARQDAFLLLYAELGNVSEAATTLGFTASCARLWVKDDSYGFAERFRAAHLEYGDFLRSLARKRLANPSGHVGGDILLIAGIAAHGNPEWRIQPGQAPQGSTRIQVTQIIINAPGSQPLAPVTESRILDIPGIPSIDTPDAA
jgi:hypothetical protein